MIRIYRQTKKGLCMEFDSEGCNDLLGFFGKSQEVLIEFDMSIIKSRQVGKRITVSTILEIDDSINGAEIGFVNNKVIWKIDEEYAEMSVERLLECNLQKEFSPAELMYVQVTGRKELDFLFCNFVSITQD